MGLGNGLGIIPKPKPKTQKCLYPKPKNIYTLTQNPYPKNIYTLTQNLLQFIVNVLNLLIYTRRLYPEKFGFWVWVLGCVLYPNQNLNPKPKNVYTQNLNPKPKNIYTLTQNPNPKIFWVQTSDLYHDK